MCILLFFQTHREEIEALPEVLADRVDLLPDILRHSRADSTGGKYENAFMRWKRWALSNGLRSSEILPAKALPVAIYLVSLIQTAKTPSPIISAFYGIKWMHNTCGCKSPTDCTIVVNVLEAAKRLLSKPVGKKEPITVDILLAMYKRIYQDNNLKSQRIIVACLLAFAGFMRSSELLTLSVCDIMFADSYVALFIESSKTDKYRDGAWILIAKTATCLCPVMNLQKYLKWSGLGGDSYVFCNICKTSKGYKVRKCIKPLSYTSLRENFLEAIAPHVDDISKYCLHSLRSGGATAAANRGIKDRMFKRHGRWSSENAKDGYIKDDLHNLLSVSLSLGL